MTRIEWVRNPDGTQGEVWNIVTGCTHSGMPGCDHCYAKRLFPRVYGRDEVERGEGGYYSERTRPRVFSDVWTHPDRLDKPLHWRKPRRVFTCSMGDLFHEDVPDEFIAEVFGTMAVAGGGFQNLRPYSVKEPPSERRPNGVTVLKYHGLGVRYGPHVFQVLTKRAGRARELLTNGAFREEVSSAAYHWAHDRTDAGYLSDGISAHNRQWAPGRAGRAWPLPGVWLGASASTQADLERVVSDLRSTPAAVRFLSLEPLLELVDLADAGAIEFDSVGDSTPGTGVTFSRGLVDWVIVGCESGAKRRPCKLGWVRSVVDQCAASGTKCFVKQLDLDGRVSKDMSEWPEDLRIRQLPVVD